jgi:LmbE family N-acetylglucosaminyl deacetylase
MDKRALAIASHPDDAEFLCAGTLALLHHLGWEIHISTMTAGDCGSKELDKQTISEIRRKEAVNSAKILDGTHEELGSEDLFILYDRPTLLRVIAHLRKIQPQLVLTMSPTCYMLDHEITSRLAQTACFAGGIVNIETPGIPPIDYIPHLYYADPLDGKDKYGQPVIPTTLVDITSVIEIKTEMLASHQSQREWLRQHHGMDEYILSMKRLAEERGQQMGVKYAEGFRQHLGHAFPQSNLILEVLDNSIHP